MNLSSLLKELSKKITNLKLTVITEEATKHSFVMPFLQALGYDIFNPEIVIPEFVADVGTKKGEKVDYAILRDNKPLIIIEVKCHNQKLDNHHNQLIRYFSVTDSKFAILTNGIEYRFFSDLSSENRLDEKPFLIVDLENIKEKDIKELEKFQQNTLDVNKILSMANRKKYILEIEEILKSEFENPSDEFIKFFASKILDTKVTKHRIDEVKEYLNVAITDFINDKVSTKINSLQNNFSAEINEEKVENISDDGIITTEEELQGFYIVQAILSTSTKPKDITYKDTKSYFGILYQNNVRKWICRLYFNTKQLYIAFPTDDKVEEKYTIDKVEDIHKYKGKLKTSLFNCKS